ncbi:MAG: tetratricopeptide repeat protein, partial [Bacillota bacterium]
MLGAKTARWTLACVVGLALVAGAATPCLAADRPPTRECWQLMSRVAELERQGRWEECIPLWRHIVAIEAPYGDDTALLRLGTFWQKIARTCDRLGRYPDAVDAYE